MAKKSDSALIGYTGFVGSNLHNQYPFSYLYNSSNSHEMKGCSYDLVICAGVSAVKWLANKDPDSDRNKIRQLESILSTINTRKFILVSTIDVYPVLSDADENFDVHKVENHAYGTHRLEFEDFCRSQFDDCQIIRLPGLFGDGIKKNVIFDLLNNNCLDSINLNSSFQYYNLDNLWVDMKKVIDSDLPLVNFFTEPVTTNTIIQKFFPNKTVGENASSEVHYDLHTCHADLWGKMGKYIYTHDEIITQLGEFIEKY